MKFAYSTNAYTRMPLADAIADVRAAGFDGVEILADVPHLRADAGEAAWEEVRRALAGFPVSNVNANTGKALDPGGRDPEGFWPSLADRDMDGRWAKRVYLEAALKAAAHIGATCISIATAPDREFKKPWEALMPLQDEVEKLLKTAERTGVRIGVEFEPQHLVPSAADVKAFIEAVPHPLLGVNLDIGHVVCAMEDPVEAIESLAGKIWNVHLEDIKGGEHRHLIPGEGEIDFKAVLGALERVGYDGFVTLELYPYADRPGEAGRKGLEYLKSLK